MLLQISPVLLVLSAILVFRQPPVRAALSGAVLAIILTFNGVGMPFSSGLVRWVMQDTLVLFASVAFVLVPGMALVVLIERTGATQALSDWVAGLQLHGVQKISFIVLGLAPLLESMTGFGVSLIATIPVLIALFDRDKAVRIALACLVIMPWGTLGLATVVGATLLHLTPMELASQSALTSAPVFICLAMLAAWIAGYRSWIEQFSVLAMGMVFVAVLYFASRWLGPEVAGVSAGAVMVLAGLLKSWQGRASTPRLPMAAWPYMLLFFSVMAVKTLVVATQTEACWVVQAVNVTWRPLASPGVALSIVCMVLLIREGKVPGIQTLCKPVYLRVRRPLLTILCFLLMSQVMVKAGLLAGVRGAVSSLDSHALPLLGTVLGGVGGYLTGSNVGGNVLMMPAIADIPASLLPSMAATMNSVAGHAALGSLPMIAMIAGLAGLSGCEEQRLVRFALAVVVCNIALVGFAGALMVYMS